MGSCDSTISCSSCTSGPAECPAGPTTTTSPGVNGTTTPSGSVCPNCFDVGRCTGTLITTAITGTDCQCQDTCTATPGCTDFTFDSSNGICSVMGSCTSLSTCSSCSSGPSVCPSTTTTTTTASPSGCDDCFEV